MKLFKKVKRLIKKYPSQSYLMLYNLGIFGWLQAQLNGMSGYSGILRYVPMDKIEAMKGFISSIPYGWLIATVVITLMFNKLKKTVKKMLLLVMIIGGISLLLL